ncbi:MAG: phosphotransferase [Acidimicrobiales bacterium]
MFDNRGVGLVSTLRSLAVNGAAASSGLTALVEQLPARLEAIAECGIPDTIVHGDAHPGNARRGVADPLWFDWGDSFVGTPLFDLMTADRYTPSVQRLWLSQWAERVPGSQPERAWGLLGRWPTFGWLRCSKRSSIRLSRPSTSTIGTTLRCTFTPLRSTTRPRAPV